MSDFIDDEASEASSSEEEESDDDYGGKKSKSRGKNKSKAKPKKSREAIDSSEEEDEDEDDEAAKEEMKDLINDEEEEEEDDASESGDSDADGAGAKRSHDEGDTSLDEDDLDLLEEQGIRVDRRKKFKRIKAPSDSDSDEEVDERKRIERNLFLQRDNLLDSDDEDVNRRRDPQREPDLNLDIDSASESDSDGNFIVDDNDQPIASRKTKKKGAKYTDSAMQQAQEIFGVDFDFEDLEEGGDEYDDGAYDEEYDEDGEGESRPQRKGRGRKTIYDVYEPAELERSHLTTRDQQIRTKDEPERFQLRSVPVTEADKDELDQEAEWIFTQAFDLLTTSTQQPGREPIAGKRSEVIKPEIRYTLECIRNEKLEVPFIAAYRREYVPSISSTFDDTRDLWTIYNFDEQWCKLQQSKTSIIKLYSDMRTYLETKATDVKLRKVTDLDIERVKAAKNFFEIEDCRLHFKLYYSTLVNEMKLYTLEKKIEEQKAAKAAGASSAPKDKPSSGGDGGGDDEGENPEDKEADAQSEAADPDEPEETEEEKLYKRLSKFKISNSKDTYQRCRDDGIGEMVQKFGLTPEQFGENLRDDYQRNNVPPIHTRPLDEAGKLLRAGNRFTTRDSILKAATYMYAKELSCDPLVRQTVRRYFFDNTVINVKPTALGMKEIDENHPCYSRKFLKNKPVLCLVHEEILHLLNAEKYKLIEIKFSVNPSVDTSLMDPNRNLVEVYYESLKALYYSDFSSMITKEWNDQREEAVKLAMNKFLMPCFEKQLREKLVKEAQAKIIKNSCDKLHNWLNVAPYAPSSAFDDYEDFNLREGPRICGFTFAPDGDAPCFAAVIDAEGELIDHVRLPFLNIRKRSDRLNAVERENQAKDRAKFKEFMIKRKPHAVALAAETIQTKYVCQDLAQILDELREHDGLPLIPIEIVDNELSNVYINLKKANDEFPEFPGLLLQAISNARRLNDPLSEYAKLCTADDDILCLRFHPLQDDLPKDDFLNYLYQMFVTRTNAVGVDPNRIIAHPHTSDIMQFVAGLGPRKGAHLLRTIKKLSTNGQLTSRQQLISEAGMTPVIFINCAGFIKLDTETLKDDFPDESITPLDSTRIHPQSYGLAKKIASDALDYEEGASEEATEDAIDKILEDPARLDDLDLAAFARELDEVQNQGKKAFTLSSIREEFQCRYRDHRESYKAPSQEEIFEMLTKETTQTFYNGKLITCQVVQIPRKKPSPAQLDMANPVKIDETNFWRCPFCQRSDFQDLTVVWNHFDTDDCPGYAIGVRCRLDNGLSGFVPTKFISDKEITDPSDRVSIGQTIHARILRIDAEKFSCDLTCRTSDLLDEDNKLKPHKDEYYDETAERNAKRESDAKSKKNSRRPYQKRVVVHPAFENIDCKNCERKLNEMEQGHAIVRPSSQGHNFLTLSWKVAEGVNQHVTIQEEGKENAFSIGRLLFIEGETYEDLDEILARYVQPMASFARELLSYKYCVKLVENEDEIITIQRVLMDAKRAAPSQFPYRFLPSRKYPGKFLLGYQPKDRPKVEYLTVTPSGFRFRKGYHRNLASLIKWFKENWNKVPQMSYPSVTPGMGYDQMPPSGMSLASSNNRQTFPMSQ